MRVYRKVLAAGFALLAALGTVAYNGLLQDNKEVSVPGSITVVSDAEQKDEQQPDVYVTVGDSEFDLSAMPEYSGEPYTVINDNVPYFTADDLTAESFETYSDLDDLGRCGVAYACIGQDIMPQEKRGDISSVKPTGWVQNKYDFVDGKSLYNRCHLIGFQLAGENANPLNLITGTRYLNVTGMLPFENMVADYVKETNGHVLYRVTPIFDDDELVCRGVLMEAESVEDTGDSVEYNVYIYNVQPGVKIDYATGDNWAA